MFTDNSALLYGSSIYVTGSVDRTLLVTDYSFLRNAAVRVGAVSIAAPDSLVFFISCFLEDNTASGGSYPSGGGAYFSGGTNATFYNCTMAKFSVGERRCCLRDNSFSLVHLVFCKLERNVAYRWCCVPQGRQIEIHLR